MEKKEADRSKEAVLAQKKKDLLKAMKEKGIKDEQWSNAFISEISITEDMDIESKADSFLKIYNKSQAAHPTKGTTPLGTASVDNKDNDPLASVRAIITQRYKEREELLNN